MRRREICLGFAATLMIVWPILFTVHAEDALRAGFVTPPIPQYVEHRVGHGAPEGRAMVRYTRAPLTSTSAFRLAAAGTNAPLAGSWMCSGVQKWL